VQIAVDGLLDLLLVHAGGPEVAELVAILIAGVAGAGGVVLERLAEQREVALVDLGEAAPARAVGGDLGALEPAAARERVEVVARVDRAIEVALVEAGARGGRGRRLGRGRRRCLVRGLVVGDDLAVRAVAARDDQQRANECSNRCSPSGGVISQPVFDHDHDHE
jgi:hypothetical protein